MKKEIRRTVRCSGERIIYDEEIRVFDDDGDGDDDRDWLMLMKLVIKMMTLLIVSLQLFHTLTKIVAG